MPHYTLRWANRSPDTQDWQISNGDYFTLQPDYVRSAQVDINSDYTYEIAVTTQNSFAAASLIYTAATQSWALTSHTPHEWQLLTGNGLVTVRCLLRIQAVLPEQPSYSAKSILYEEPSAD